MNLKNILPFIIVMVFVNLVLSYSITDVKFKENVMFY